MKTLSKNFSILNSQFSILFVLGCVFLFNPIIATVDILPDFIGCVFLAAALSRLKYIDARIERAASLLKYIAALSLVRTVLMFFVFNTDSDSILSSAFLLGIAEAFALVYFALELFGGLGYIAQRSECLIKETDDLKALTIVFAIARGVFTVLPELTAIPALTLRREPDSIPWLTLRELAQYKNYTYAICILCGLVLGGYWLYSVCSFVKKARGGNPFCETFNAKYSEFNRRNPSHSSLSRLLFICPVFLIGCVFLMEIRFDGTLLMPAWAGTVIFAFAAFIVSRKNAGFFLAPAFLLFINSYFLSGGSAFISAAVFAVAAAFALAKAEEIIIAKTLEETGENIKSEFILPNIFFALYLVFAGAVRIVGEINGTYFILDTAYFHAARIICGVLWLALTLRLCSSITDELKRRLRF